MTTVEGKLPNARINAALAALQMDLPQIAKDNTANVTMKAGGTYRYKYADLADVSDAIMPRLGKHGLSFTSRPTLVDGKFVLLYELRHESGEEIPGVYPLSGGSPQEIGGLITYARRYCLCAITGVAPADGDDDAQLAEKAAQRRQRREAGGQQADAADEPRITADQQRDMQALFQQLGITDKAERLKFAAAVAKRELRSATGLKKAEADNLLGVLKAKVAKKAAAANATEAKPDPEQDPEAWVASQEPPEGAL